MTDNSTSAGDGETKDEGIMIMEEGKQESGHHFEASSVCFDGLFAYLGELKERGGGLTISMSHPALVLIVEKLSTLGMEQLMKKRFYDQLDSLRDFTKMHGHCLVPADHPTLGEWVRLQHKHYMLCKKRLPSPLTSKRFTKLKEISGFDEFEKPREEKKDDLIGAKLSLKTLGAQESQGKASPSDTSLALDEKIRLKKAMNKVRLMTKAAKGFSSSEKEISGFDEFEKPREEKKDDLIGSKPSEKTLGAQESQGKASPSDTSLALDEKIRLKKAMNKVRLMAKATKGFSSTEKKKLPDKEVVAAQIRRKRAKGTSHRRAVQNSQRMTESFTSLTESFSSSAFSLNERDEGQRPATEDAPKDEPLSIADTFDEAGGLAPAVDRSEKRREKVMRKRSGNPRRRVTVDVIAAHGSERGKSYRSINRSGEANRKKLPVGDCSRSMTVGTDGGGNAKASIAKDDFEDRLSRSLVGESPKEIYEDRAGGDGFSWAEQLDKRLNLEGNVFLSTKQLRTLWSSIGVDQEEEEALMDDLDTAAAADSDGTSSAAGKATGKNMGAEGSSQSMPVEKGGNGDGPGQRSENRQPGAVSVPTKASTAGSTFEDRLRRKLDGESSEEIYGDRAGGDGSSSAGEVTKKKMGQRSEDRRPGAVSVPAKASIAGSTFEDRLRQKLDGESPKEIYGDRVGGDGSSLAGEVTKKKMGKGNRSRSMPIEKGGGGNGNRPGQRSEDRRPGAVSLPAKASTAGSNFEDLLRRKLEGENPAKIHGDRAGGNGSSAAGKATRKRIGAGDRSQSTPVKKGGGGNGPGQRSEDRRPGAVSVPAKASTAGSTFEDRLRRKLDGESPKEIYGDRARGDGSSLAGEVTKKKIGAGDRTRYMSVEKGGGGNGKGPGQRSEGRQPGAVSVPANASTAGSTFEDRLRRKLEGESPKEIYGDRAGGDESSAAGKATRKKMGAGDHSRSMPVGTGGGGNGPGQRSEDRRPGAVSVLAKASIAGSTFEDRLRRKLDGESPEKIYRGEAGGDGSSAAGEATRKKMGAGDLSRSMPIGTGGDGNGPGGRFNDRRLGASVPANASIAGSTFEDRLRRKLDGESPKKIYGDWAGGDGSSAAWASLEDEASDEDSIGSPNALDRFSRRDTSRSNWMDKLNGPGWDSRDDMVAMGLASWTNLDETLPPGRRYSRWKLVFCRGDGDDGRVQSDCVSSVLNTVIFSERWHVVPKENGDVALEMTTQTPDEHKTVELSVQKLSDLFTRSDFYFY